MPGQGTHPAPPRGWAGVVIEEEPPPAPKVEGVFEVGDVVSINGQASRLWHVIAIDLSHAPATIKITPDCSCGGPTWVTAEMLIHNSY